MKALSATLFGAMLAFPMSAMGYASLQLSPDSVTLDAGRRVGQIVMSSLDAHDLIFDLEPVSWTQHGDKDSVAPTRELIVVPPVYDVQPYSRIVVRVAAREGSRGARERAFVLRFREVLAPGAHGESRTLTAPVFVAPAERHGKVRYELQRAGPQGANLLVNDESNVHDYLGTIHIESSDEEIYSGSLDAYVLAGNSRTFALQLKHPLQSGKARLMLEDAEHAVTTVDVPVR